MLKTTLLATATVMALGVTAAHAGYDGHRRGGYEYSHRGAAYKDSDRRHGWRHGWRHKDHRHGPSWFDYRSRPYCRYEPRKVRVSVWDRRGRLHRKWVWRDVRVCA